MKYKIKIWNKKEFGNVIQEKKILEALMGELQSQIIRESRLEDIALEEGIIVQELEERWK